MSRDALLISSNEPKRLRKTAESNIQILVLTTSGYTFPLNDRYTDEAELRVSLEPQAVLNL